MTHEATGSEEVLTWLENRQRGYQSLISSVAKDSAVSLDDYDANDKELRMSAISDTLDRLGHNNRVRRRRVVELHYGLDGNGVRSFQEIGNILGITERQASRAHQRAIQRLRYFDRILPGLFSTGKVINFPSPSQEHK